MPWKVLPAFDALFATHREFVWGQPADSPTRHSGDDNKKPRELKRAVCADGATLIFQEPPDPQTKKQPNQLQLPIGRAIQLFFLRREGRGAVDLVKGGILTAASRRGMAIVLLQLPTNIPCIKRLPQPIPKVQHR